MKKKSVGDRPMHIAYDHTEHQFASSPGKYHENKLSLKMPQRKCSCKTILARYSMSYIKLCKTFIFCTYIWTHGERQRDDMYTFPYCTVCTVYSGIYTFIGTQNDIIV